jgi:hypothetical protein
MDIDTYENDPGHWGASLTNLGEVLIPCLDAIQARSVGEVGAYAGDLTRLLLDWAARAGAGVFAIDPSPAPKLVELADQRPELELIRETSHDALRHITLPDALIIDGDHNYYTVSEELRLIGERAADADLPLLLFHDVCWPHGRRDTYCLPERIPDRNRQPMVPRAGLFPGEPGLVDGGLTVPLVCAAEREGGPRNGVLTAIEDFVGARDGLRLAIVPIFFGFGVVWHRDAPWADAVAEIVEAWDRNPLLERLEENRVYHLSTVHIQFVELGRLRERNARQERLLRMLLDSSAFASADRLSHLRRGGRTESWREQVRQLLDDDDSD